MRFLSTLMFEPERNKKIRFAGPRDLSVWQLLSKDRVQRKPRYKIWRQFIFWALTLVITLWWVDLTVAPDHSIISELFQ